MKTLLKERWKLLLGVGLLTLGLVIYGNNCGGGGGSSDSSSPGTPSGGPEASTVVTPPSPTSSAGMLALGFAHGCVVIGSAPSQGVQCWGLNNDGQLGDGTTTSRTSANWVLSSPGGSPLRGTISGLAAGSYHTCVKIDDQIKCWGRNFSGQINSSDISLTIRTPLLISGLASVDSMALGAEFSCFLTRGGVQCMGDRESLGRGSLSFSRSPLDWVDGLGAETSVSFLATGQGHACAIQSERIKCWGYNYYGNVGDGTTAGDAGTVSRVLPSVVALPSSAGTPLQLALNTAGSCAVTTTGTYCWGSLLGPLGPSSETMLSATLMPSLVPAVSVVSSGAQFSLSGRQACLFHSGQLRCLGDSAVMFADGCDPSHTSLCPCDSSAAPCSGVSRLGIYSELKTLTTLGTNLKNAVLSKYGQAGVLAGADLGCKVSSNFHVSCWGIDNPTGASSDSSLGFPFGAAVDSGTGAFFPTPVEITLAP